MTNTPSCPYFRLREIGDFFSRNGLLFIGVPSEVFYDYHDPTARQQFAAFYEQWGFDTDVDARRKCLYIARPLHAKEDLKPSEAGFLHFTLPAGKRSQEADVLNYVWKRYAEFLQSIGCELFYHRRRDEYLIGIPAENFTTHP